MTLPGTKPAPLPPRASQPAGMSTVVVRMAVSGNIVAVDLTRASGEAPTVLEARRGVAAHIATPPKFVRLMDTAAGVLLDDGAAINGDVSATWTAANTARALQIRSHSCCPGTSGATPPRDGFDPPWHRPT